MSSTYTDEEDGVITTDFMDYAPVPEPTDPTRLHHGQWPTTPVAAQSDHLEATYTRSHQSEAAMSVSSSGYGRLPASRPQHKPESPPEPKLELDSSRTGRMMREKSAGSGLGKRLVSKKQHDFVPPSFTPDTTNGISRRTVMMRDKSKGTGLGKQLVPKKVHEFVPPSFTPETNLSQSKKAIERKANAKPRIYQATDEITAKAAKSKATEESKSPTQGPFGPQRYTLAQDRSPRPASPSEPKLDFVSDGQFPVAEPLGERSKLNAKLSKTCKSRYAKEKISEYKPLKGPAPRARRAPTPEEKAALDTALNPPWHRGKASEEEAKRATARVESPEFRKAQKMNKKVLSQYRSGYKPEVNKSVQRPKTAPAGVGSTRWTMGRSEYTRRRADFGAFETAYEQGSARDHPSVHAARTKAASSGYGTTWSPPVRLREEQLSPKPEESTFPVRHSGSEHWPRASDMDSEGGYNGETIDLADAIDFERLLRHTATDQGIQPAEQAGSDDEGVKSSKPWWHTKHEDDEDEEMTEEDLENGTITTVL